MALKPPIHGRDHCPGGADPIPCLTGDRAYMNHIDGITVTDENTQPVTGYDADLSVDGTGIVANEVNGRFELSQSGIYLVQAVVNWADTFAGDKMTAIRTSGGNLLQDINNWPSWSSAQDLGTNIDTVCAEALLFVTSIGASMYVTVAVRQTSGTSQDVSSIDFSIARVGPY